MSDGTTARAPRVAVVADDLIWATRLADGIRRAGGEPVAVRSIPALEVTLASVRGCIVDLTARGYEGPAAVRAAAQAGVPVIAVGQHDDATLRRAARQAGAARVHAYRALSDDGSRVLDTWVASLPTGVSG